MSESPAQAPSVSFGPFLLFPSRRVLLRDNQNVRIGSRALDLLMALLQRAGEVVGKQELLTAVWPGGFVEESNLRVQLALLRKALGDDGKESRYIVNVPLRGYAFVEPIRYEAVEATVEVPRASVGSGHHHRPQLPQTLVRVIGRDALINNWATSSAERRLLTITGPGGVGKTTVALAIAGRMASEYPDGAAFVDLSPVVNASWVAGALSAALRLPILSEDRVAGLTAWLADKRMLIVLDNCEHVIDAAAQLVEALLREAPYIRIIATSREPLRVPSEWVQRLPTLAVPPWASQLALNEIMVYPAAILFIERAEASMGAFHFTDADAPLIAEICQRLDGLPLAIELVAARVEAFGLQGLRENLDDRIRLKSRGRRTANPRQQTLQAALDWSYDLLTPAGQDMLMRLSVFRERFDIEAALTIAHDGNIDGAEELFQLVSKSLVSVDTTDRYRPYRLLETARSHAAEKLTQSGGVDETCHRHAQWCLDVMQTAENELQTLEPNAWHMRHVSAIGDVRAALRWAFADNNAPLLGARLAAASTSLWLHLGLMKEALLQLNRALLCLRDLPRDPLLEVHLCVAAAHCAIVYEGPTSTSNELLQRAESLQTETLNPKAQMLMAWTRFMSSVVRGEYVQALDASSHFGQLATNAGDDNAGFIFHRMTALALHLLGDQPRARNHVELALQPAFNIAKGVLRGSQLSDHRSASLAHQARILWVLGLPDQAMEVAREACAHAVDLGTGRPLAYTLSYACCPVALWSGDLAAAARYIESLKEVTQKHALAFWQGWPQLYLHALSIRRGLLAPDPAPDFMHRLNWGHQDMLATMDVGYLPEETSPRPDHNLSIWCSPEILRSKGERLLASGAGPPSAAEALFREALALAQRQGALGWSLRAEMSLARLLQAEGRGEEGLDRLQAVHARFHEGHQTHDLIDARRLMQDLGADSRWLAHTLTAPIG